MDKFIVAFEGLGGSGKTTVLDHIFRGGINASRFKFPLDYNPNKQLTAHQYLLEMKHALEGVRGLIFIDRYKFSAIAYARARGEEIGPEAGYVYNLLPNPNILVYLNTTPDSSAVRDLKKKGVSYLVRRNVNLIYEEMFRHADFPVLNYELNPASLFSVFRYIEIANKVKSFALNGRIYGKN